MFLPTATFNKSLLLFIQVQRLMPVVLGCRGEQAQ